MSSWPSADLWRLEARPGGLKDLDLCPACSCPAAVHYSDPSTKSLKCPPPGTDPQRMVEMVKRAPGVYNATKKAIEIAERNPDKSEASRLTEWWKEIQVLAGRDLAVLEPYIIDLVRRPELSKLTPREIVIAAKGQLNAAERVRELDRRRQNVEAEEKRLLNRLAQAEAAARFVRQSPGIDASPQYWRDPQRTDEPAPQQAAPPAKPSGKRRYNLDE